MSSGAPNVSAFRQDQSAWQKARDLFTCNHEATEIRCKTNSAGVRNYRRQCLVCGGIVETLKTRSLTESQREGAPEWDEALRERWDSARWGYHKQQRQEERDKESAEFWRWYSSYLRSSEWMKRRELVLRRAGGVCEGCGSAPAVFAHHLTYARVGKELLFDLVAVCGPCHQVAHPDKEIITESYEDPSDLIRSSQ